MRVSSIRSELLMRTHPWDDGAPSACQSTVPWMYSSGAKFIFTRPIGLAGPGGSGLRPRAHSLFGGCHHGFHVTSRIRYSPAGVSYPRIPTDTLYVRVRSPFS